MGGEKKGREWGEREEKGRREVGRDERKGGERERAVHSSPFSENGVIFLPWAQ